MEITIQGEYSIMTTFIAFVFVFIIPILAIYFGIKWFKVTKQYKDLLRLYDSLNIDHETLVENYNLLQKKNEDLQTENNILSPYRVIVDAKAEAHKIVQEGQDTANSLRNEALQALSSAQTEAKTIIDSANQEAKEIAAEALDAKKNAETYKRAEKAIINTIRGFGNEYIIPNASLLDDLAEEYSHKEAGEELKKARMASRMLVKEDKAATCDYAELSRRVTAIKFVIDAFTGKVDSVLSKVKHDNYGKLKAEIESAFEIVNLNGSAFRNARITPEYLASRLNELKWAATTNELKRLEQEEQRMIREAMREEEKARREYEKAIAEAEKEEKMLQKAMAEARKQLESASQEEKAKYEQQLAELQEKLTLAEEKNQRALSMAQQTKSGHVYVISNIGSFGENVYKIGMTRRLEPQERINELGDASVPFPFDVHAMIHSENAPTLEKSLHKIFSEQQMNKVNPRKEFFTLGIADIKKAIEDMGINAHWTLVAEAREYHESKALKHPVAFIENAFEDIEEANE